MGKSTRFGTIVFVTALNLTGCAAADLRGTGLQRTFQVTRLQYAILIEDQEALRRDFDMNPDRIWVERTVAGLSLPFSAAVETLFLPVSYGISSYLGLED